MNIKPISMMVAMSLVGSTVSAASWVTLDARSGGMAGLSVVTSNIDVAPFTNPAMLAAGKEDEDFGAIFAFGATVADPNDFTGTLDVFNDAYAAIPVSPLDPSFTTSITNANTALGDLGGKGYQFDVGGGLASGFKMGEWAAAFSAIVTTANDFGVGTADGSAPTISFIDGTTNASLKGISVNSQDIGLSFARSFELNDDFDLAVGITPKMQTISIGEADQPFDPLNPPTVDSLDLTFGTGQSTFNTDVGVVARYNKNVRFGLAVRNMIAQSYLSPLTNTTISIQPQMRAGVAYTNDFVTVGLDLDLAENTAYVSGVKSKYMIIGTEFNAWNVAQLRLGYRTNSLDSNDVQTSLGLGLFDAVNIGAMTNPNNAAAGTSAYMSFGLKF